MKINKRKILIYFTVFILILALMLAVFIFLQTVVAHKDGYFVPQYERVKLDENSDYKTIFLQTGLGKSAAEKLITEGRFDEILEAQDLMFNPPKANCEEFLGWFTREDTLESSGPELVDIRPGDILISLSTHSFSWRHGHSALVLDEDTILEAEELGKKSKTDTFLTWNDYSNYAHLRLKNTSDQERQEIADYALKNLNNVPYMLTAGFIGKKAPKTTTSYFSVHCSYLVWYAFNNAGFDLDSDGGRLVTTADILNSDLLEVVQIYGIDPNLFADKIN